MSLREQLLPIGHTSNRATFLWPGPGWGVLTDTSSCGRPWGTLEGNSKGRTPASLQPRFTPDSA
jgi:hypothetical protein